MRHDARPAAEAMDGIYRHQRHIYDATRRYFLLGRDEALARLQPPKGGRVVEIGCGTGRNLIRAARRYPEARFFGFDVSREMLATAACGLHRHRLEHRAKLAVADATSFALPDLYGFERADRILISYVLSMIPEWPLVVDRATAALAPQGALHIVDFGTMSGTPPLVSSGLRAWLALFDVTPRNSLRTVGERAAARHGRCLTFCEGRLGYSAHAFIA